MITHVSSEMIIVDTFFNYDMTFNMSSPYNNVTIGTTDVNYIHDVVFTIYEREFVALHIFRT